MSRVYDSWEKLVGAVLDREELRRLALCDSFSSISTDFSSRFSFDSNPVSRSPRQKFDPTDPSSRQIFSSRNVMAIKYEEIKKAIKIFQGHLTLGEEGFGRVFKGWFHEHYLTAVNPGSGIAVAVKQLNNEEFRGHTEWVDEIHYLSQLCHPNLVKLIGHSFHTNKWIVVYEFMSKESLNKHLFTRGNQWLPWVTRIKVAVGTARALAFLHDLEIPVIHRNIKSDNILLDDDFNPKLSDFALAIDGPTGDMTHIQTQIIVTYGYAAPEYLTTGFLTTRCDVYSYGVVLLELISGLRVIDPNRPDEKLDLVSWAKPYLQGKNKLGPVMDSRLKGQYPPKRSI